MIASKADARLDLALRAACKAPGEASLYTIAATAVQTSSMQLLATPLHPAHRLNSAWQEPLVLVIISDTRQMAVTAAGRMRDMYGLTVAESVLVAELAEGKSVREIPELRAVAVSTLRTQLMAAFTKTGVRRQAELIPLVAALAPIVGAR